MMRIVARKGQVCSYGLVEIVVGFEVVAIIYLGANCAFCLYLHP